MLKPVISAALHAFAIAASLPRSLGLEALASSPGLFFFFLTPFVDSLLMYFCYF